MGAVNFILAQLYTGVHKYRRIAFKREPNVALIAVGHSILVVIYQMLSKQTSYHDLGGNYLEAQDQQAAEKRLVRRLEKPGYRVERQEVA
jgi:transposase